MTKKKELINYIKKHVNTTNELLTTEQIVSIPGDNDFLGIGQIITRGFSTTNEKLIKLIDEGFSDDLIGNIENQKVIVEIVS